ncbi:hypothetical protein DFH09DRAFT_1464261 [Mycena vulgaris]|nr:hypothetical protein DFH09DRAFT_1464261 [Mycena vulgaris]
MCVARMTLAEVVQQLREEEGVWFDGMDWSAKRWNAREQEEYERRVREERERKQEQRHRADGSDDSSAVTPRTSDSSPPPAARATPPAGERLKEWDIKSTIPVSPVLNPPRLLSPIPYIPETIAHLPPSSLDALRVVWREACTPLYHCRCSVSPAAVRAASPAVRDHEKEREKDTAAHGDGPCVVHIPSEDDATAGAESVAKLVEEDGGYRHTYEHENDGGSSDGGKGLEGLEALTAQELYWLQVEQDEGPGTWEREMQLAGAFAIDGEEDEEDADGDGDGDGEGEAFALNPAPAAWVAPGTERKRSVERLAILRPNSDGVHDINRLPYATVFVQGAADVKEFREVFKLLPHGIQHRSRGVTLQVTLDFAPSFFTECSSRTNRS